MWFMLHLSPQPFLVQHNNSKVNFLFTFIFSHEKKPMAKECHFTIYIVVFAGRCFEFQWLNDKGNCHKKLLLLHSECHFWWFFLSSFVIRTVRGGLQRMEKVALGRTFYFDKSDRRGHCRLLRWKAEAFEVCSRKFNFAALPLASSLIPFMNFNDLIKYFISLAGFGGNFDVVKSSSGFVALSAACPNTSLTSAFRSAPSPSPK